MNVLNKYQEAEFLALSMGASSNKVYYTLYDSLFVDFNFDEYGNGTIEPLGKNVWQLRLYAMRNLKEYYHTKFGEETE